MRRQAASDAIFEIDTSGPKKKPGRFCHRHDDIREIPMTAFLDSRLAKSEAPQASARPPSRGNRRRSHGPRSSTPGSAPRQHNGNAGSAPNHSEQSPTKSNQTKSNTDRIANTKRNHERYLSLASTAVSTGDATDIEDYNQHAEHYFRQIRELTDQD